MAQLSNLGIAQCNCRGVLNKQGDLSNIQDEADRLSNSRGALAIALRRGITFSQITSILSMEDKLETLATSIGISLGELLNVSVYRVPTPTVFITSVTWTQLFDFIKDVNCSSVVISDDCNCHNSLWGSSHYCRGGMELCSALDKTDPITLNTDEPTFRTRPGRPPSIIDLTFVYMNLYTLSSWGVWNDSLGSDHFPVISSIGVSVTKAPFQSHRYKFKRINWFSFSSKLSESISQDAELSESTNSDCISKYEAFVKSVDEAVLAACQRAKPAVDVHRVGPPGRCFIPAPWWGESCDVAVKERKAALTTFRRLRNDASYINLYRIEVKTTCTLKSARRINFRKFCETLDRSTPISRVWRVVKCFKNRYKQPAYAFCSVDRSTIENLHALAEELCPPTAFFDSLPKNFPRNEFLEAPFIEIKLSITLASLKTKCSPGLDRINYNIIQRFPNEVRITLFNIFNEIYQSGSFSKSWNEFLVLFIPKSILENSIQYPQHPACLRKRRSCAGNLAILSTDLLSGFANGEIVAGIFLNLKGAFPSVNSGILIEDLKEIGFPRQMINGQMVGPRLSTVGLPQGSILSPINYSIYTRKIHTVIPKTCLIIEFADGIAMICRSVDLLVCIHSLQQCLNALSVFLDRRGLEVCPEKTKLVLFNRRNFDTDSPCYTLTLNGIIIPRSPLARFLDYVEFTLPSLGHGSIYKATASIKPTLIITIRRRTRRRRRRRRSEICETETYVCALFFSRSL
ncbi:uncharacterized protein LOC117173824 [Belonocnema kinseyi]|uniref:uncharacterized protein LOC117173824 n=1 Tax=Belonocnema kinseyi TaxID=2817044 RepID=UPI00143D11DA|nr:uncharacterized protein LOC117173824 [Belonocnema kinseyi]